MTDFTKYETQREILIDYLHVMICDKSTCVSATNASARIVSSTPGWKRARSNNPHRRGTSGTYSW